MKTKVDVILLQAVLDLYHYKSCNQLDLLFMKVTTTTCPMLTNRADIRPAELASDGLSEYKPVHLFLN